MVPQIEQINEGISLTYQIEFSHKYFCLKFEKVRMTVCEGASWGEMPLAIRIHLCHRLKWYAIHVEMPVAFEVVICPACYIIYFVFNNFMLDHKVAVLMLGFGELQVTGAFSCCKEPAFIEFSDWNVASAEFTIWFPFKVKWLMAFVAPISNGGSYGENTWTIFTEKEFGKC